MRNGWQVHARPGEFHLEHGDEQIDPHQLVLQLSDGVISKEAWSAKCAALGIEDVPLAVEAKTSA